jgi:hypothetical protein
MSDSHAAWDELAAGHAVGALEPEEEHAFTGHLRGCDRCRATLASLAEVAGQLAYAVEPAEPPEDLGRRILDAAAAERPAVFGTAPPPGYAAAPAPRTRRPGRVWQPTFRLATLATAAAVVAALSLTFWNLSLRGSNEAQQAAIRRRTAALSCLAAPGSRTYALTSATGTRATACVGGGTAYVVADGLPRNEAGTSNYVLWWLDAQQQPHAVERFDVEGEGTAVFALPFDVAADQVPAMAVSLEPGDALPTVPTRVVATGKATSA